ncbi:MAG: magnesium transporter [Deltaproteobacteria bacterium]|nr:magnesium transporter [Deltaproteobacteria bacterium]
MSPILETNETPEFLVNHIREALEQADSAGLKGILEEAEPAQLADVLYGFNLEDQLHLIQAMSPALAAEILPTLNESYLEALLAALPPERLTALLALMEPDDAAFLVSLLEEDHRQGVIGALGQRFGAEVKNLLSHEEDTAGRLMDPDLVRVRAGQTVGQAVEDIRQYVARVKLDDFFTVFVVNDAGELVGVVPTWRMLLARPSQTISEVMSTDVVSVGSEEDQEEVVKLVRDHDLVTLPVVDDKQKLIGRITVDDVVDVIEEEFEEDMGHLTGTQEEVHTFSVLESIRVRSPWLLFALCGLFLSAVVMTRYQGIINVLPQLAFFTPLVMAMGGNAGMQSSSLVIRGLATGEVQLSHFWWRLGKELMVSLNIGVLSALLLLGAVWILSGNVRMAMVVGIATNVSILTAAFIGISIPMGLRRAGFDPALATGPFLTTTNDILGTIVYLMVAFLLLG